jgi:transposase
MGKETPMTTVWLGADVAKASMMAAVAAEQVMPLGEFANEAAGFAALAEQVGGMVAAETVVHLVVEPTGGYEMALVAFAYAQGWQVSLPGSPLGPKRVRDWAKGIGKRAKTDGQDADLLARYGAERRPAAQAQLASEVSELDSLLKRRHDLEQMLQQEKNRLQEMAGRPGIADAVESNLAQVIAALQEALRQVEEAIASHLRHHAHLQAEVARLVALPGIGPKVVLPLLVLLYRWQNLTDGAGNAKGLTALTGFDPKPYLSGSSVRKRSAIAKMGNAEMRRLLYMGALSAVHGHNPLHTFYERLVARGKPRKVAVVAAARKLLTWAWVLFSRQTTWDPSLHAF